MSQRKVEGNSIPGNPLSGDDKPVPLYCPVCGREPVMWYWTTVGGDRVYPSLVCYGSKPDWLVWLSRRFSLVEPTGAHYQYEMPSVPTSVPEFFDRMTGEPIRRRYDEVTR